MKVVILAAGFARRLHPLTLTQAKALLPVAGQPMIDYLVDALAPIPGIDSVYVAANARFADQFEKWAVRQRAARGPLEFRIVDDGSADEAHQLGALGDLQLVLERGQVDDDVIVVGGDNLFSGSLAGFGEFCRRHQQPVLGVFDVGSIALARNYGVVATDPQGRIRSFVEKPAEPESTLVGIALYYFPRTSLPLVREYFAAGNDLAQPGHLIQWLFPRVPVLTWNVPGSWYDIGSKETLEEANRVFSRR